MCSADVDYARGKTCNTTLHQCVTPVVLAPVVLPPVILPLGDGGITLPVTVPTDDAGTIVPTFPTAPGSSSGGLYNTDSGKGSDDGTGSSS